MKRFIMLVCAAIALNSFNSPGQNYPSEWRQYTNDGYVSDIQHDNNSQGRSETDFRNYLTDIARTNLAKQIQIKISDHATLNKISIDGRSSTAYSASTSFKTELNVKLIETKSHYNSFTKEGYAIAYINKSRAASAYAKDIRIIFNKISSAIAVADTYVSTGFKSKARTELSNAKSEFGKLDEPFFWLGIYDYPDYELDDFLAERRLLEQSLTRKLSELQHGISICLKCSADMFGVPYMQLSGDVKESLSSLGCNFCDDSAAADWVIAIRSAAEEYNCVSAGGHYAYFSYVHANVSVFKTATGQTIYEGELSEKGSHTHNYNQAARDAYKKIVKQISDILKQNIK